MERFVEKGYNESAVRKQIERVDPSIDHYFRKKQT